MRDLFQHAAPHSFRELLPNDGRSVLNLLAAELVKSRERYEYPACITPVLFSEVLTRSGLLLMRFREYPISSLWSKLVKHVKKIRTSVTLLVQTEAEPSTIEVVIEYGNSELIIVTSIRTVSDDAVAKLLL
jgi:hypothetical protein